MAKEYAPGKPVPCLLFINLMAGLALLMLLPPVAEHALLARCGAAAKAEALALLPLQDAVERFIKLLLLLMLLLQATEICLASAHAPQPNRQLAPPRKHHSCPQGG